MASYPPQEANGPNGSANQWPGVTHLQLGENGVQYVRVQQPDSSNPNGDPHSNSALQRQTDQGGTVITRMAPYGGAWSYPIGSEHIRIPAPESLPYGAQVAQAGYPPAGQVPQKINSGPQMWPLVKEEPEDLTGRRNGNNGKAQDGLQRPQDGNNMDSGSDSDSDLCIDEGGSGNRNIDPVVSRRKKIAPPPGAFSSVTTAELQKRPGVIPLTNNLAGPVQVMTAKDGAKLYSCPECDLFYADHLAFEIHLQAHGVSVGKRHICKECGTTFRRREHLDAHMTAHSQDRPYTCGTCGRAFKRNEHLTRHRVLHSGEKQHACNDCGKSFYRKDHLLKHSQTHIIRKIVSGEG